MGQAKRRGDFEDRKAQAIAKNKERRRIDREAYLQHQAERDALMDRDYVPPERTGRPIGTFGYGRGIGRRSSMMLMAAMLAGISGINITDNRRFR